MSAHEQFAEDLSLYALGTLEGEERTTLEQHLETCASCRLELDQLRGDMALMATAVAGPKPPQRSRERLLTAIAKEPRSATGTAPQKASRGWWGALGWVAAAVLLLLVFRTRNENSALRQSVANLGAIVGQQVTELAKAQRVVDTITAPETQKWVLVAAKTPQPQGRAFYLRDKTGLVFVANNLPALAPEKIYELWLIPKTGAPVPAGLFRPDAHGSATVVNPPLPAGVEAKTFAVTLESESGPHDAPHGPAVMAGTGE